MTMVADNMDTGVAEITVSNNKENGRILEEPPTEEVGKTISEMVSKASDDILGVSEYSESCFRLKKRKDAKDNMDVDTLLTSEDKENFSKSLKQMTRKNLEELVLKKVVEGIMHHSESGKNSIKIFELQAQKEKLFSRVGSLQNKVQELTKVLSRILDMQAKDPSNLFNNRKLHPIRYYRSVGLQVNVDQQLKLNGYNKVIQSHNPTLQVNGSNTNTALLNHLTNGHAGNINNTGNQIVSYATNPQTAVVKNSPVMKPSVMKSPLEIARTPIAATNSATAKCVDLTSQVTKTQSAPNTPTVVTIPNSNRVQYSYVKPSTNAPENSIKLVPSSQGNYIIKPILNTTQSQTVYRPVPRPTGANAVIRPNFAAAASAGFTQRAGVILRSPLPQARRNIALPALPPAGIRLISTNKGQILKEMPSKPDLTLNSQPEGIVLSWTLPITTVHADIESYQIYACQEQIIISPGKMSSWKKVGDVKALPLPMACTLSQFTQGNRYFFIVRAIDVHGRTGSFCDPKQIVLRNQKSTS